MRKETTEVELKQEDIDAIWELVCENPGKRQAHLMISREIGLPAHVVRAVIRGRYCQKDGKAIVTVPIADHKVTPGRTVVGDSVQLVGEVVGPAKYVPTTSDRGCSVPIDVGGEEFDILVTRGRRPWDIEFGTTVKAIGLLGSSTLWVDEGRFWRY